jgi:hypothetical protein
MMAKRKLPKTPPEVEAQRRETQRIARERIAQREQREREEDARRAAAEGSG